MGPDAEDQSEEEYGEGDYDEDEEEDEDGEVGKRRIALDDSNDDPSLVRNSIVGSPQGHKDA